LSGGMSEEQVRAVPRRRSRAEAGRLAAEFEASGLSRREFCRSRGLNVSTLDAYRKRLRQSQPETCGARRWVAVEVAGGRSEAGAAAGGLAVVLGQGRRIEVSRGFDAATLEQLLSVFERA
jgi:hypothetical protein